MDCTTRASFVAPNSLHCEGYIPAYADSCVLLACTGMNSMAPNCSDDTELSDTRGDDDENIPSRVKSAKASESTPEGG
jgi:hypothetical protein